MPTSVINEPDLALDRHEGNIFVITMRKAPENRLNSAYCQKLINAFNLVRTTLGSDSEGAVITRGNDAKFWCTGGACPLALSHDYRVMNSTRGYLSMPPINLGLHFPGIGTLLRLKLPPKTARKMLLQAHRWTGPEALDDGIVDYVAEPEEMFEVAMKVAREWSPKAKMGVYALLRNELYGEAGKGFREISYVYGRRVDLPAKAKI